MFKLFVFTATLLLINQCEMGTDKEKSNKQGASLSFADQTPLQKEAHELFDITVKVKDINLKIIKQSLVWDDGEEGMTAISERHLDVDVYLEKEGEDIYNCYSSDGFLDDGETRFKDCYYSEACVNDCQIVAKLIISGCDDVLDRCFKAEIESVDKVKKTAIFKESPYEVRITNPSSTNILVTVTKDNAPVRNSEIKVHTYEKYCLDSQGGLHQTLPLNSEGGLYHSSPPPCVIGKHVPFGFSSEQAVLDANGSWSVELDADGSWKKEAGRELSVCGLKFSITVDRRKFSDVPVSCL